MDPTENKLEDVENFVVPEGFDHERADKILASAFPDFSRSRLQKIIDSGDVRIAETGVAVARKTLLSSGDTLAIKFPKPTIPALLPAEIPLDVVYEDDDIIVINKESGIITHPGAGTGNDTLVHALLHHTKGKLAQAGGEARPGVVHRLDKETSGLILFAKTDAAYYSLVDKFRERDLNKEYIAIVDKAPELLAGTIDEPIERHPTNRLKMMVRENGKPARTDWFVEEKFGTSAALVRCVLHTGRTHQIRVHLAFLGHPILGDKLYGGPTRFPRAHFSASDTVAGRFIAPDAGQALPIGRSQGSRRSRLPHTSPPCPAGCFCSSSRSDEEEDPSHRDGQDVGGKAGAGWLCRRVMLHAAHLSLEHPISGKPLDFTALPPPDFANLATFLRERFGSRLYSQKR